MWPLIDLGAAGPEQAFAAVPTRGTWRRVRWKGRLGEESLEGTMLVAGPETGAPEPTSDWSA